MITALRTTTTARNATITAQINVLSNMSDPLYYTGETDCFLLATRIADRTFDRMRQKSLASRKRPVEL